MDSKEAKKKLENVEEQILDKRERVKALEDKRDNSVMVLGTTPPRDQPDFTDEDAAALTRLKLQITELEDEASFLKTQS